ncbi:NB-ARC and Ankyrin domain protein [Rutstroemia sp. NJR-2017a WRK4]|nr:NB-ARC and Ankyrin domain protein [Rutstroemia sp. NJR-2017a WRK4]
MRLLEPDDNGGYRLTRKLMEHEIPRYAILSHTWGTDDQEVNFDDVTSGVGKDKNGYEKIQFCGNRAAYDHINYFWVDSCCIKKSSDAELSESLNSMFYWYKVAAKCYVYLSDVFAVHDGVEQSQSIWEPSFRASRWFTRGWTLQELLAPVSVEFFSQEGKRLGDKESLKLVIQEITKITTDALQGIPLARFSVSDRKKWAERRITTRQEDAAYSMLGIFGVSMPVIYGEGKDNASRRLECEIQRLLTDEDSEPAAKRRKVDSQRPEAPSTVFSQITKSDLINVLRFDQIDDRFHNIRSGHSRTCKWLLTSSVYLEWLNDSILAEHHGFFWVRGKPGSGKSTLTKFTFLELKKSFPDTPLLSFFFNARGTLMEKSTLGLYRSLLVQFLNLFPDDQLNNLLDIPTLGHGVLEERLQSDSELLRQLLVRVLQIFDWHNIMIVIDALDECDEDEIRDMIELFEQLGENAISSGKVFHVLFSSRHYPHITIQRSVQMILEDQNDHSKDIEKYVASELKVGHGRQLEQIKNEICDKASGIFMWVVLAVKILKKALDHGQVHALRRKLQELPTDLHELFRSILTRDTQNMEEMKLCLQWILYAKRPLKREELYFAILSGLEPHDPFQVWDADDIDVNDMSLFILSSSKGLAEITKSKSKNHTVQFIHESVRDFLLKENGLSQVLADIENNAAGLSHDRLKECCIHYMRQIRNLLPFMPNLPPANTPKAIELRMNASRRFQFLEYATHNILPHADSSQAGGVDQRQFIVDFRTSDWVNFHNLLEKTIINRLEEEADLVYILAERDCPNLIELCQDRIWKVKTSYGGRYGNPVFAAIAKNSQRVFDLFDATVTNDVSMEPQGLAFLRPEREVTSFLIKNGSAPLVPRFLQIYNVDVTSWENMLSWALDNGKRTLVELLLRQAVRNNIVEEYTVPLLKAVNHKEFYPDFLHFIISLPEGDKKMLLWASISGNNRLVEHILDEFEIDINIRIEHYGNILLVALVHAHRELAELCIARKANTSLTGEDQGNVLAWASARGYTEMVKVIIDQGTDVNAPCKKFGSALVAALRASLLSGHREIEKLLLAQGADANASCGEHGEMLQVVIAKELPYVTPEVRFPGIGTNASILEQYQYHLMALEQQHKKRLMMARDEHKQSSLGSCMHRLIDLGANVNARGGKYGSALQAASARGYFSIVELLLDRGADVNTTPGGGYSTPRELAEAGGFQDIVELLKARGQT